MTERTVQPSGRPADTTIDFNFSPEASGVENTEALQRAVDQGGTVTVTRPGTYSMAGTVYLGSHTSLVFGNGVFLKKVDERGPFTHLFLNKGALSKTYDRDITISGLHLIVNGVDQAMSEVYGLRGQLAFFYVKDLRIERFRCLDLAAMQFAIHVCTFEDLVINDVIIKGDKDGVHLGRGRRFTISNGVFQTYDDAVALNAHDYATSNPELGWIENGLVQNCHDLADAKKPIGFFCRILAGGWCDWRPGLEVQQSDSVISQGRVYRVQAKPDGTVYTSHTQPTHEKGSQILDGINWGVVQSEPTHTAGVRNVVFRDIFLHKPRTSFSIHFDNDRYSRSYYPGAEIPQQKQLFFENIRVLHDEPADLLRIGTPVDALNIANSSLRNNRIHFLDTADMPDYLKTRVNLHGCLFNHPGPVDLLTNDVDRKEIFLKASANMETHDEFCARTLPGNGTIRIEADLKGLN